MAMVLEGITTPQKGNNEKISLKEEPDLVGESDLELRLRKSRL